MAACLAGSFAGPQSPVLAQGADAPVVPTASVGLDTTGDGRANVIVSGVDRNQDGIPDVLQTSPVPPAAQPQPVVQPKPQPSCFSAFAGDIGQLFGVFGGGGSSSQAPVQPEQAQTPEVLAPGDRVFSLVAAPQWQPRPLEIGDAGTVSSVQDDVIQVIFDGEPPLQGPLVAAQLTTQAEIPEKLRQEDDATAQAKADEAQKIEAKAAQAFLRVQVPFGVVPGQALILQAPDGQRLQVTIPPGVQPGQQLQVPY